MLVAKRGWVMQNFLKRCKQIYKTFETKFSLKITWYALWKRLRIARIIHSYLITNIYIHAVGTLYKIALLKLLLWLKHITDRHWESETKVTKWFRNPRAWGYSVLSTARVLLRVQRFLNYCYCWSRHLTVQFKHGNLETDQYIVIAKETTISLLEFGGIFKSFSFVFSLLREMNIGKTRNYEPSHFCGNAACLGKPDVQIC